MSKTISLLCVILLSVVSIESRADVSEKESNYRMGIALAMPSIGFSLQSVISEQRTLAIVVGNGLQAQLNFTGDSSLGGYYLVGLGRDDTVALLRAGYGYVWEKNRWSFHMEASLNLPVWQRELGGLADIGKIVYLFPIGVGVHYRF